MRKDCKVWSVQLVLLERMELTASQVQLELLEPQVIPVLRDYKDSQAQQAILARKVYKAQPVPQAIQVLRDYKD